MLVITRPTVSVNKSNEIEVEGSGEWSQQTIRIKASDIDALLDMLEAARDWATSCSDYAAQTPKPQPAPEPPVQVSTETSPALD